MTYQNLISFIGEDKAESFFNTEYQEAYHSKIGPLLEAEHKFVNPVSLKELITKNQCVKILDLFFGLGYNTGMALDSAYKVCKSPHLEIIGIEKDCEIISKIKELNVPSWYKKWEELLSNLSTTQFIKFENVSIQLYIEDIFNIIDKLPKKYFDVIFFDPFSHKTTPLFWEPAFLTSVFNLLIKGGTLTTYSGLKKVEQLANELGYTSTRIEPFGRKKHSLAISYY